MAGLFITAAEALRAEPTGVGEAATPSGGAPSVRGCGGKGLCGPSDKSGAAPSPPHGDKDPSPPASHLPEKNTITSRGKG